VTALDAASGDLEPRLAAALARLNRGQREVLLLHAWADLGNDEIAAALRIPQGTVRSRLSRARAFVRAELAQPNRPAGNAERNAHA
jgi:RNA polymerase sigma-70 factor (ECF subfamily)